MRFIQVKKWTRCALLTAAMIAVTGVQHLQADNLYIGDNAIVVNTFTGQRRLESTVKRFDAANGAFVDTFVAAGSGDAFGIRGLIFDESTNLLAVDQNVGLPINGEVLRYSGVDGSFLGNLVPEPTAPYAPRGMVLGPDNLLYVADMGEPGEPGSFAGGISRYDATTGALVDQLSVPGLDVTFHPRGLVFGSDGMLYASNFEPPTDPPSSSTSGSVLRFDPASGDYLGEFVARHSSPLLRSEGIVFGPDGDLYAVSFRFDANDTDKILQFDGQTGDLVNEIDFYQAGEPRVFAQALLFGPGGKLFVPMTNTGEVRQYDVTTGSYDTFISAGGALTTPWYLTFGNTDPSTLSYVPEPGGLALLGWAAVMGVARRRRQG